MKIFNSLKIAFAMYSKIPVGRADWTDENMKYSMCFVPLVGFLIGMVLIGWCWIGVKIGFNVTLLGSVASLVPILVTGGIHMDGYIDVMDALSSYGDREKKLCILKDPHVGAFAIIWTVAYMIATAGILCQAVTGILETGVGMAGWKEIMMISFSFALSRALACFLAMMLKNARNEGTLYSFTSKQQKGAVSVVLMLFIFGAGIALCVVDFLTGLMTLLACAIVLLWFCRMVYKNFGGMTGDMAGFFIQVSELVMAFVIVAGCRIVEML